MKTGFKNLAQLKKWFNNKDEWEKLRAHGYDVYKVPALVGFYSKRQVVFIPKGKGKKVKI